MAELLRRGELLPHLAFESSGGRQVRVSDFKNRRNIVLLLCGTAPDGLLNEIAERHDAFLREEAAVIAAFRLPRNEVETLQRRHGWPFAAAADAEGKAHRRLGASSAANGSPLAAYVTDFYGEIFWAGRKSEASERLTAEDLLGWLQFVNMQCPECHPPGWGL